MDDKVAEALGIIDAAVQSYPKISVGCSFGKDSIVTVHLAQRIDPDIPVFSVMTPFKPKETFTYKDMMTDALGLNLKTYMSKEQVPADLHKTDPNQCCFILKVKPTMEAVKDLDAWIAGLRRDEGHTRTNYDYIETRGDLVKINPILNWTEAEVWRYLAVNQIPVHPWYGLGYRSLGCACCSLPNTEKERSGRWANTDKVGGECGLHSLNLRTGECLVNSKISK